MTTMAAGGKVNDSAPANNGGGGGGSAGGQQIASFAQQYLGYPYAYAGEGPYAFDCSGFTKFVILNTVGIDITHDMFTQVGMGQSVGESELQPGDLVFFANTFRPGLSHAGVYVGGGQFVHAENESTGVVRATSILITTDRAGTAVLASAGRSPDLRQRDPRGTRAGRQARAAEPAGGSERGAALVAAPLSRCLRCECLRVTRSDSCRFRSNRVRDLLLGKHLRAGLRRLSAVEGEAAAQLRRAGHDPRAHLLQHVRVVLEELLGVLATLAEALLAEVEPGPALAHDCQIDADVEDAAVDRDALRCT